MGIEHPSNSLLVLRVGRAGDVLQGGASNTLCRCRAWFGWSCCGQALPDRLYLSALHRWHPMGPHHLSLVAQGRQRALGLTSAAGRADDMTNTHIRLREEAARLGGDYVHVHDEPISPGHDDIVGEARLHGRFTYICCTRRPLGMP